MQNKPQLSAEMEKRFDEAFTYIDDNGDRYLLGGFDKKRNINTDRIPELKHFLATALEEQKKEDAKEKLRLRFYLSELVNDIEKGLDTSRDIADIKKILGQEEEKRIRKSLNGKDTNE